MMTVNITFLPPAPEKSVTLLKAASAESLDRMYVVRMQDGSVRKFPIEHIWEITEVPDCAPQDQPAKTGPASPRRRT